MTINIKKCKMSTKESNQKKGILSETELNILKSFFPEGKEITLKTIIERSGYSYEPVYRTVKELVNKKVISVKKFGKTLVYNIDFKKQEAKIAYYFYTNEKVREFSQKHKRIFSALSKLSEEKIDFLAVFGSYAKNTQTNKSDVDIISISSKKQEIERNIKSLKYSSGLEFSPVVLPKTEFVKIQKENKQFWNDLIEYGIIFKGHELFYYYAYLRE